MPHFCASFVIGGVDPLPSSEFGPGEPRPALRPRFDRMLAQRRGALLGGWKGSRLPTAVFNARTVGRQASRAVGRNQLPQFRRRNRLVGFIEHDPLNVVTHVAPVKDVGNVRHRHHHEPPYVRRKRRLDAPLTAKNGSGFLESTP
jgi:hypothetical protein